MQTQRTLSLLILALCFGVFEMHAAVQVLEQGQDYEKVRWIKQAVDATGRAVLRTNEYTEVGSGLNHLDENGRWVRSQPRFESHSGGIVGTGAGHRVILSPNINVEGSVDLQMTDGKRMVSHPLCLRFYDPDTGQSLIIAILTDSAAQLLSSNEVIYPYALVATEFRRAWSIATAPAASIRTSCLKVPSRPHRSVSVLARAWK